MNPDPSLPISDEVDRRLRIVSELRNLCLSLGKAKQRDEPVVPTKDAKEATGVPAASSLPCRLGP